MTESERKAIIDVADVLASVISHNAHLFVGGHNHAQAQVTRLDNAIAVLRPRRRAPCVRLRFVTTAGGCDETR